MIYVNQKWCHDKINVIFACIMLLLYFSKDINTFFFECQQHVTVHTCAQVRKLSYSHYDDDWEDICIKTTKYTYIKVKYKNIVATGLPSTSLQHLTFKNFNIWWTITYNIWKKSLTVCRHKVLWVTSFEKCHRHKLLWMRYFEKFCRHIYFCRED